MKKFISYFGIFGIMILMFGSGITGYMMSSRTHTDKKIIINKQDSIICSLDSIVSLQRFAIERNMINLNDYVPIKKQWEKKSRHDRYRLHYETFQDPYLWDWDTRVEDNNNNHVKSIKVGAGPNNPKPIIRQ